MDSLLGQLDSFNRKERYALVSHALGLQSFTPSYEFVSELLAACGVKELPHPGTARCWMDYHMDWLYAALFLTVNKQSNTVTQPPYASPEFPSQAGPINVNTNQEDIDLLVAVTSDMSTHLFLVEAKWASGWSTGQMTSKIKRLKHIFGPDGRKYPGVRPHLVLASKAKPTQLLAKPRSVERPA